jgi:hypothetical protein
VGDSRPQQRLYEHLHAQDAPPLENVREAILEREVTQLRGEVKRLQTVLKCAAKTLAPYAKR